MQMQLMNRRLLAILCLGFASGLPLALTSSTLQAWFTEANISLVTIGALTLLGIPYTLKFLWAPLMDYYSFPKWGRRKGWILVSQFGLVLALLTLSCMLPTREASWMGMVALGIAFLSASQDIAINAYQTDILEVPERGIGASYTIFAYRIAGLIAGGLALIFADHIGWQHTYQIMVLLMFVSMVYTLFAPQPTETIPKDKNLWLILQAALRNLLTRDNIIWLLLFVMFYKIGDALALSLMSNFLLHGLGFTLTQVGLAYKIVGFAGTILGTFVGGVFLMRWQVYRGLLVFGVLQMFSNLMFALLALVGKHFTLLAISIFIESFCSGLSTAALLAFLMALCDHHYTATQFALLSAVSSLGRVFLGPVASLMVLHLGWVEFYIWSTLLCLPGLLLLIFLKNKAISAVPALSP